MIEALMHYVWEHRLWPVRAVRTVDGHDVEVVDPGTHNASGPGPDFFNAKVRIGGQWWAGNVEMHQRASDWRRHGHDHDQAYDNVILHVVEDDDCPVRRIRDGSIIPQVVMRVARDFRQSYEALVIRPGSALRCHETLQQLPPLYMTDWVTALAYERLYDKAHRIMALAASQDGGGWYQAIYATLARGLGFGTHAEAMQDLARIVPLRLLGHHADDPLVVEALLLGGAGLLFDAPRLAPDDPYVQRVCQEFKFLAVKYGLQPMSRLSWQANSYRPANAPCRRIVTLAAYVSAGFHIDRLVMGPLSPTLDQLKEKFDVSLGGYWARRSGFGLPEKGSPKALSPASIDLLIINVAVPLMFAHGLDTGDDDRCQQAVDILTRLRPEQNSVIRLFQQAGVDCPDAFTSQALVQLNRQYCLPRKCLYCRIGHRMLAAKATVDC